MNYLKNVNKKYNFIIILIEAIIYAFAIYYVDKADIPSSYLHKYNQYYGIGIVAIIAIILILSLILKIWKKFTKKEVIYFDRLINLSLITELAMLYDMFHFPNPWKKFLLLIIAVNFVIVIIRTYFYSKSQKRKSK